MQGAPRSLKIQASLNRQRQHGAVPRRKPGNRTPPRRLKTGELIPRCIINGPVSHNDAGLPRPAPGRRVENLEEIAPIRPPRRPKGGEVWLQKPRESMYRWRRKLFWTRGAAPRQVHQLKEGNLDIRYLAGIVDGEGTISCSSHDGSPLNVQPYVAIANNHRGLIDLIAKEMTELGLNPRISTKKPRSIRHNVGYTVAVVGRDAIKLAMLLQNILIVKFEQARILAEDYPACTPRNGRYSASDRALKNKVIARLRELNRRGTLAV